MIDSMYLFNYSLPNESLELNGDFFPLRVFNTEVDTRFNETNKPAGHGIWVGNTFYGKRLFHMEGDILGNSSADYMALRRHMLRILTPKSHLSPRQPLGVMDVVFTGMPEKIQSEFTLDSYPEIPIEALSPSRTAFQLNLKAFDPRLFTVPKTQDLQSFTTTVNRTYAKTYPKTYTSVIPFDNALNHLITNSGDIETPPIITLRGAMFINTIMNTRSNVFGTYNKELHFDGFASSSTSSLVIDFGNKTIKTPSNGRSYNGAAHGDWWQLEPGDNLITVYYNRIPGATDPITASVTWKDAYMI